MYRSVVTGRFNNQGGKQLMEFYLRLILSTETPPPANDTAAEKSATFCTIEYPFEAAHLPVTERPLSSKPFRVAEDGLHTVYGQYIDFIESSPSLWHITLVHMSQGGWDGGWWGSMSL